MRGTLTPAAVEALRQAATTGRLRTGLLAVWNPAVLAVTGPSTRHDDGTWWTPVLFTEAGCALAADHGIDVPASLTTDLPAYRRQIVLALLDRANAAVTAATHNPGMAVSLRATAAEYRCEARRIAAQLHAINADTVPAAELSRRAA